MKGSLRERALDIATFLAAVSAVIIAAIAIHDRTAPSSRLGATTDTVSVSVADWSALAAKGRRIGVTAPALTIVEFGDFECPACGGFAATFKQFREAHPRDVALVFRHWPLSYHRFAYPAARAAECAANEGRFARFYEVVYERQDSLGLLSFREFGRRAGISDLARFEACLSKSDLVPEVEEDLRVAQALGGRGTPTLVVNGVRLGRVPTRAQLEGLLESALSERKTPTANPSGT